MSSDNTLRIEITESKSTSNSSENITQEIEVSSTKLKLENKQTISILIPNERLLAEAPSPIKLQEIKNHTQRSKYLVQNNNNNNTFINEQKIIEPPQKKFRANTNIEAQKFKDQVKEALKLKEGLNLDDYKKILVDVRIRENDHLLIPPSFPMGNFIFNPVAKLVLEELKKEDNNQFEEFDQKWPDYNSIISSKKNCSTEMGNVDLLQIFKVLTVMVENKKDFLEMYPILYKVFCISRNRGEIDRKGIVNNLN